MHSKKYSDLLFSLRKILAKEKKIILTTHKNPDGDALGSTLALGIYLQKTGHQVSLFYQGKIDAVLNFLPKESLQKTKKFSTDELLIVCDACEKKRTGKEDLFKKRKKIVFIDHHPVKMLEKNILAIVRPKKSATCEIIADFLLQNDLKINAKMATCLLTGLFTDTGGFLHSNTTSHVMQLASQLMQRGASLSLISKRVFTNKRLNILKIWGRALERARLAKKNGVAFSYITKEDLKECNAEPDDLNGVGNILGAAEESKCSLILTQIKKGVLKGSLRSEEYKNCDVSKIAKKFGGGGHPLASGFEIRGKELRESFQQLQKNF